MSYSRVVYYVDYTCGHLLIYCKHTVVLPPLLQAACTVVATLLHYFFLAAFSWMLCEGIMLYNLLVKVFGANKRKWIYIYTALGWGGWCSLDIHTGTSTFKSHSSLTCYLFRYSCSYCGHSSWFSLGILPYSTIIQHI